MRLSHPAAWSGPRRQLLLGAATRLGLERVELVAEPVAAALAYAHSVDLDVGAHVAVWRTPRVSRSRRWWAP